MTATLQPVDRQLRLATSVGCVMMYYARAGSGEICALDSFVDFNTICIVCLFTCLSHLLFVYLFFFPPPFPSNRHHLSNGDCLEGNRDNHQVCSVQYCVQQLYTVNCTHMNRPNSSLDWVLSHWAHFTVLRFIFVYVLFCA